MNNEKIVKYAIIAAVFLAILNGTVFVVDQTKQALVVQFGEVVRAINKPGMKAKIPLVQNVIYFDKRILDLGIEDQEVIASDQKRLIINAFTKYKIIDPLKFTIWRNYNAGFFRF
jgi:membrane protease subunit HflC